MKDLILYSDEELMQEIKVDNMFAFDVLYRKYSKEFTNLAFPYLNHRKRLKI